jgi:hypothetical protein
MNPKIYADLGFSSEDMYRTNGIVSGSTYAVTCVRALREAKTAAEIINIFLLVHKYL